MRPKPHGELPPDLDLELPELAEVDEAFDSPRKRPRSLSGATTDSGMSGKSVSTIMSPRFLASIPRLVC
jgi:hypothetical protein